MKFVNIEHHCRFEFEGGGFCKEPREGEALFCFFHDSNLPKHTPEMRERISQAIQAKKRLEGAHLEGVDLSRANLESAWLVRAHLDKANLERAHLEGARLYGASFRDANLFNANLRGANLKECDMEGANLLEVKLDRAKILGVHWGKHGMVQSELEGRHLEYTGDFRKAKVKFREAEEIYRNICLHLTAAGLLSEVGTFFYREMVSRRKQKPFFSVDRVSSKMIDILCGYGEKTFRVFLSAFGVVLAFSLIYFFAGLRYAEKIVAYDRGQSASQNLHEYFLSFYFSLVTFTTLGYGDIIPMHVTRLIAGIEAFFGAFMIAFFVLVFSRKLTR